MKLSYLINLALLILVLLLLWLNNHQQPITDNSAETLTSIDANTINSINIKRNKKQMVQLEKVDSIWQLSSPIKAPANETRIALLLRVLKHNSTQKLTINKTTDLAKYGLAEPSYSLFLNELQFDFGDASPIQKGRYVKHNDSIYVIDDAIAHLINSSANAFIDNQLINKSLSLVKLKLPTANFELIDGYWQSNIDLNHDEIMTIINGWEHAQALQVLAKSQMTPKNTINLRFKGKQQPLRLAMTLNKQSLSLYDIDSQLSYQFTPALAKQLFLTDNTRTTED